MRCPYCGRKIEMIGMFCPFCGKKITDKEMSGDAGFGNSTTRNRERKKSHRNLNLLLVLIIEILVIIIFLLLLIDINDNKNNKMMNTPFETHQAENINTQTSLPDATATSTEITNTPAPKAPEFENITVSSTRDRDVSDNGHPIYYYSSYLMDDIMENCWTPDRENDPSPWIKLSSDTKQYVTGILFTDGYFKSEETYNKNSRISKVEVSYDGGTNMYTFNEHSYGSMQSIVLPEPVYTDYIKIKIIDWVEGPWKDLCVSEIKVY